MKKKTIAIVFASLFLAGIGGCITKIQVIDDGSNTNTNKVQNVSSGFNDETYVWESWLFSTNHVDK